MNSTSMVEIGERVKWCALPPFMVLWLNDRPGGLAMSTTCMTSSMPGTGSWLVLIGVKNADSHLVFVVCVVHVCPAQENSCKQESEGRLSVVARVRSIE
jgi:hypothetical protein